MSKTNWGAKRRGLTVRISSWFVLGVLSSCSSMSVERPTDRGSASATSSGAASSSGSTTSASAGAPAAEESAAGEAGGGPAPAPAFGWCEAQPILAVKCGRCHAEPPENGAPFPLATYADVQRTDARGRPRYERMQSAIETSFMPATFVKLEPPVEPLTDAEREVLLAWLVAGAPEGERDACP